MEHQGVAIMDGLQNCRGFGTDQWSVISLKEPSIDWIIYKVPGTATDLGVSIGASLEEVFVEYRDAVPQPLGTDNYYVVSDAGPSDIAFVIDNGKVSAIEVGTDSLIAQGRDKKPCA